MRMTDPLPAARLTGHLNDGPARTLELVHGLDATHVMDPRLDIVKPLLWEIGHVGWFHEYFALRRLDGGPRRLAETDALYNSSTVLHDVRWELTLPSLQGTLDYMARVQDAMVQRLDGGGASEEETSLYLLIIFHEAMHDEAFTYTRQTLGYPTPAFAAAKDRPAAWRFGRAWWRSATWLAAGGAFRVRKREMGAPRAATSVVSSGLTRVGAGGRRPGPDTRSSGCGRMAAGPSAGLIAPDRLNCTTRSFTSTGTRRILGADGPDGDCRLTPSGRQRRQPSQRRQVDRQCTNAVISGEMKRPHRTKPISMAG
jgi:DinB superfamily